jgi:uncharacterized Zn finger protein (UPF0148 family)
MKILRNYSERHFETKLHCEKNGATLLAFHSGRNVCATHRNENVFENVQRKRARYGHTTKAAAMPTEMNQAHWARDAGRQAAAST